MICNSDGKAIVFVNEYHNTKTTITSKDGKTVTCLQFDKALEILCSSSDCDCTYETTISNEPVILAPDLQDENIYNIITMHYLKKDLS